MSRIRVSTVIDAPPDRVWADVRDIATHVLWMADAVAIRFLDDQREGVGTTFDCDTKVGPLSLTDRMTVTQWRAGEAIGVRHSGLVTGDGIFRIRSWRGGRTRFTWEERLVFPWWMGGRVGAVAGAVVLKRIWKGNLGRLKHQVETAG